MQAPQLASTLYRAGGLDNRVGPSRRVNLVRSRNQGS